MRMRGHNTESGLRRRGCWARRFVVDIRFVCVLLRCAVCRLCCCCCCSWWCFCKYYFVFVFLLNVNYDGYYTNECNNEAGFVCLGAQKVIYWRKRKEIRFMAIMLSYTSTYSSRFSQKYLLKLKVVVLYSQAQG